MAKNPGFAVLVVSRENGNIIPKIPPNHQYGVGIASGLAVRFSWHASLGKCTWSLTAVLLGGFPELGVTRIIVFGVCIGVPLLWETINKASKAFETIHIVALASPPRQSFIHIAGMSSGKCHGVRRPHRECRGDSVLDEFQGHRICCTESKITKGSRRE